MQRAQQALSLAVLRVLQVAAHTDGMARGVSLARLSKHLGQSASVLLRALAPLGDAPIAGQPGLAWVKVSEQAGRSTVYLTALGESALRAHDLDGRGE